MKNFSGFIGLPFKLHGRDRSGVDCWGLIRLVFADHLGIDLPAYEYSSAKEARAELVESEKTAWVQVSPDSARPYDVVLLRVSGLPLHVGVVIDPPRFLHILAGVEACLEKYTDMAWRNRLLGIYRHVGMIEE